MTLSDIRGLTLPQFSNNQKLIPEDFNAFAELQYKHATNLLAVSCMAVNRGVILEDIDFVVGGAIVRPVTAMTAEVLAGAAVSFSGRYFDAGDWGFVAESGSPFAIFFAEPVSAAFSVGGASVRYDIVEARPVRVTDTQQLREFVDPDTGEPESTLVNTRYNFAAEVQVRTGTPGSDAPATTAGWIKLAEVRINLFATTLLVEDIRDVRRSEEWTTAPGSTKSASLLVTGYTEGLLAQPTAREARDHLGVSSLLRGLIVGAWKSQEIQDSDSQLWSAVCSWQTDGRFCAVAADGHPNQVATSTDGARSWTKRTTPNDREWSAVCWSPTLTMLCAVAKSGTGERVMTSTNGTTWNARTTPADNSWEGVCWSEELTLFCAVASSGTGNRVMTSANGVNWTSRTSAADNSWNGVCYGGPESSELFVAVASTGDDRVMTSVDGTTWIAQTTPAGDRTWRSVVWSSEVGLFVAVASTSPDQQYVMTSPNGETWTLRTTPTGTWRSVAWSPALHAFVAVAPSSTDDTQVMLSADGVVWYGKSGIVDVAWQSIAWDDYWAMFCAVANDGSEERSMATEPSL